MNEVTDGKQQNKEYAGEYLSLHGDDGQYWGDEASGAGSGQHTIGQSEDKGPGKALNCQAGQEPSRERTLRYPEHIEGNPDQQQANCYSPIRSNIAEHGPKQRTDETDDGNSDKEPGCKDDGVERCLTSFDQLILIYR